jgi:hypothetical protein
MLTQKYESVPGGNITKEVSDFLMLIFFLTVKCWSGGICHVESDINIQSSKVDRECEATT